MKRVIFLCFGEVHYEYCQLSDAKSKVQQFCLFWPVVSSQLYLQEKSEVFDEHCQLDPMILVFPPFKSSKCQMKLIGSWFKEVGGGGGWGGQGRTKNAFPGASAFGGRGPSQIFCASFDAMCQLTHTEPKVLPGFAERSPHCKSGHSMTAHVRL